VRFIDANVFLYALLKPRRKLSDRELEVKEKARAILSRVNSGELVLTTVVHLSEVANVLEDIAGAETAALFLRDLFTKENIVIEPVSPDEYLLSTFLALEKGISVNDALAYIIMKRRGVSEIYTFDKHFEKLDVKIARE
jgi:predicted nucleic acid-binding protein